MCIVPKQRKDDCLLIKHKVMWIVTVLQIFAVKTRRMDGRFCPGSVQADHLGLPDFYQCSNFNCCKSDAERNTEANCGEG